MLKWRAGKDFEEGICYLLEGAAKAKTKEDHKQPYWVEPWSNSARIKAQVKAVTCYKGALED